VLSVKVVSASSLYVIFVRAIKPAPNEVNNGWNDVKILGKTNATARTSNYTL
jgi:hypothetical protein